MLNVDDIAAPDFFARGIMLSLPEDGSADLQIAELHVQQRDFRRVRIRCAGFALSTSGISCHGGSLAQLPGMTVELDYRFRTGIWQVSAQLRNVSGKQAAVFLPTAMPGFDGQGQLPHPIPPPKGEGSFELSPFGGKRSEEAMDRVLGSNETLRGFHVNAGELNGTLRISGDASGVDTLAADVKLDDVGFSDVSGLHAAEKMRGLINLSAAHKAALWTWQGNLAWQSGDLFWQPLFLRGGSCDTLLAQPAVCGSNCQAAPDETTSHSTRPSKNDGQVAGYPAPDGSTAPCRGGYQISASGSLEGASLKIEQAVVDLPEAGRVRLAALVDTKQGALLEGTARGENLALEKLYSDYARPFLDKGVLADASLQGHADVDWQYHNGATQALRLSLRDMGVIDAKQRFALLGLNSEIDWQADASHTASIVFSGGTLLGVPLGAGQWALQMNGMEFSMAQGNLPVLGGNFELRDFNLHRETVQKGKPCNGCANGHVIETAPNYLTRHDRFPHPPSTRPLVLSAVEGSGQAKPPPEGEGEYNPAWHWQFAASLSRISMEQFSQAVGWPKMLGTLAGRIPKVSYDGAEINVDGALLFNLFDGTVVATQLKLTDPFGLAPSLSGNLNMRDLDLDLLTRTFSFGNMQGRIDVDVNNLELVNWQPTRFDAHVFSSAGNYPRKISQKAVQNISALGGVGAVAAIQRSYLRFFENFGYDRIGWSCVLRNGVCRMGGVDDGKNGTYAIVKGGGIPAITVMGYNRDVSWGELITRLKRVTQNNVQPVVK